MSLPAPVDLGDLLEPFSRRGIDLELSRLQAALAEAGHPERRFAAVQVAGTNGKGSIATLLEAILLASGLRCGAYRSPHLISWCERITLNGAWIGADMLRADLERWQLIGRRHRLTPFELLTGAAFDRFAIEAIDLVVLEVGLGGRLDATTTHPDRTVLGFGTIGLDHCEHLGDSLTAIAREKAAVMGPARVAVSAPQPPQVAAVLAAEAARLGTELRWVDPLPPAEAGGPRLGLGGAFQRQNGAVATAMALALRERGWTIPDGAITAGLAAARWPGRLEMWCWRGRPLLIDGAHNPPAAAVLRGEINRLKEQPQRPPRRWLLGIQRHKQAPQMLDHLLGEADRAAIVPVPAHGSWSLAELIEERPQLADRLVAMDDPGTALDWLTSPGPLPVVAGSLVLLGAIIPLLDRQAESCVAGSPLEACSAALSGRQ